MVVHLAAADAADRFVQEALWQLGGVPRTHRTDRLSAAYRNLSSQEFFEQCRRPQARHRGEHRHQLRAPDLGEGILTCPIAAVLPSQRDRTRRRGRFYTVVDLVNRLESDGRPPISSADCPSL
jgi:hypothetical protein